MVNKKYLDKVIGSLVRSTKINYDEEEIEYPFTLHYPPFPFSPPLTFSSSFSSYCRNYFGLTKDEIRYIWKEYKNIIKEKVKNEG